MYFVTFLVFNLFKFSGRVVGRPRRSGTSSRVVIFRARSRYSLNFRPISNCREQAIGSKSRKKKNNELKTRKVTKYIYSFRNIEAKYCGHDQHPNLVHNTHGENCTSISLPVSVSNVMQYFIYRQSRVRMALYYLTSCIQNKSFYGKRYVNEFKSCFIATMIP